MTAPGGCGAGDPRQTEALGGAVQLPLDLDRDQAGPVQPPWLRGADGQRVGQLEEPAVHAVPSSPVIDTSVVQRLCRQPWGDDRSDHDRG